MNNLLLYCGLVDAKTRYSDKDLPVLCVIIWAIYARFEGNKITEQVFATHSFTNFLPVNKAVGNIGGSLMSLGQKEKKNIKKLAKSVSHKVEKVGNKARKSLSSQHRAEAEQNVNFVTGFINNIDKELINISKKMGHKRENENRKF